MRTVTRFKNGIAEIDGVELLGDPSMSILALGSGDLDIYEVGDELTLRGWYLDRQQFPPSLHLTVTPAHAAVADQFLKDLRASVAATKKPGMHHVSKTLKVGLVRKMVRLLPPALVSKLTSSASALAGLKGSELPQRSAAMYGMMAALPNRGDLEELVLDLLDEWTRVEDG
jgi:hypothetical protein